MDCEEHLKTVRLCWEDPYLTRFTASAVKVWQVSPPGINLVLDRTAFYPESGGQPWDLGRIGVKSESSVTWFDVQKVIEDENCIVHVISGNSEVLRPGVTCVGEIDWQRRFDHMQQHTGQHILSRAFEIVSDAKTVGFHMGQEYVSIDLDTKELGKKRLQEAEDLSNQVIFEDMAVVTKEYSPEEVPKDVRQRKGGHLDVTRVVHVGDFDVCACGGTHVKRTGEVGLIKITGVDKAHGGIRVFFVCGWRALNQFRQYQEILENASGLISQSMTEIPNALRSFQERMKELERRQKALEEDLLDLETEKIIEEETRDPVLIRSFQNRNGSAIRIMAQKVSSEKKLPCVFFLKEPAFQLVVSIPADKDCDARLFAEKVAKDFGARGGGNSKLAQVGLKEPLRLSTEEIAAKVLEIWNGAFDVRH